MKHSCSKLLIIFFLFIGNFVLSQSSTITRIITDYGGFWNTTTTTNNPILPDNSHHLLAFEYNGVLYSTGVNNTILSTNGISYVSGNFKALPAILNGTTSGSSLFIAIGSMKDGSRTSALISHPAIKDFTIQSVLSDGINGLDLGTGYTNLPTGATSNFVINSIIPSKIADNEPDIVFTQIADPSGTTAVDTYRFLDAAGNQVGNSVTQNLTTVSSLGSWLMDLYSVSSGVSFSIARPTGVGSGGVNTSRNIRLIAFKLSDFGINESNYSQIRTLQATPSGVTDVAFVAYNASAINVPPSISQNLSSSNTIICTTGGSASMQVLANSASGGSLTYYWEESIDNGNTWSLIANSGNFSGATTNRLNVTSATTGYRYRATVIESGTGYTATSSVFTISSVASTPLSGTLNPSGFSNCLNASSGTSRLIVTPTGGTGNYTYEWYKSTVSNGTFTVIPQETTNTLVIPLNEIGTTYYKVLITSGCLSNLSNEALVTINGDQITSVVNGSRCNTGTVTLSATATGGTIRWYNASTAGTLLGSGSTYTTPSISTTTTYFVETNSGSCISPRVPVIATIANTNFTSTNFNLINATDICPGGATTISLSTSSVSLSNGSYVINYTISGANSIANADATLTINDGYGTFSTVVLPNSGLNTLIVNSIKIGECNVSVTSGNTIDFNVLAGPSVSSLFVDVSDGCSNVNSIVTISSTTLSSGTYVLTYSVTGTNSVASTTAQINYIAGSGGAYGSGTFTLPILNNVGDANKVHVTGIQLLGSTCVVNPNKFSENFARNATPLIDAGAPVIMCANDDSVNITEASSAQNYSALVWSSSDGQGVFSFNTTEDALNNTRYTPTLAERNAANTNGTKVIFLTLTGVGNAGCANISKTVTLTIKAAPNGGSLTPTDITGGKRLTLSGHSGTILRWEYANNESFASNVVTVSNTSTVLDATNLTQTRYYRAVLSNAGNCIAYSSIVAVGTGGSVSVDNATICAGTNTVNLTLSGNSGTIVKWQSSNSSNFATYTDINFNESVLNVVNLTNTTYYRAVVDISGTEYTSSVATVTVNPASVGGTVSGSTTVCIGVNSTTLSLSGRTGSIVKWQSSTTSDFSSNVTDITNTNASITVSNLLVPTYYRAEVKSGVCGSAFSSTAFININDTNYWTGATGDTKWHTPGNWSCNSVPTINTNVVVDSQYYSNNNIIGIYADAFAKTINVSNSNPSVQITLYEYQDLRVADALSISNSTNFIIKNTANLFQNSNSNFNLGNVKVEKLSSPLFRLDYVMWSSPVLGSQPLGFVSGAATQTGFSPLTSTNRFYIYNTTTNFFNAVPSTSTFSLAKGYLIRMPNDWVSFAANATPLPWLGTFNGVPNNGTISYPLDLTGSRFNFVGNPYPSSIDLQAFLDANVDNIEGTIWIWRKTNDRTNGSSYSTLTRNGGKSLANGHVYNYDRYLAPGQGFIVKAKVGATNLVFNNTMRATENVSQFFRQLPPVYNRFWIDLLDVNNQSYNQHMLSYSAEATLGFDDGFDGKFINDTPVALVSSIENTELVIQARPSFNENDVVPLLFKTNVAGNFKIKLSNFEGLFVSQDIFVRDNVTGIIHNLKVNDYSFTSESGIFPTRFDLLYQDSTLGGADFDFSNTYIYTSKDKLIVNADVQISTVLVYDLRGRLILSTSNVNANSCSIDMSSLAEQVLLVKVHLDNGMVIDKKIIY